MNPRKANDRTGLRATLLSGLAAWVILAFLLPTGAVPQTEPDTGNSSETEEVGEEDRYDYGPQIVADQPAMNNYEGSPKTVDIQKMRESEDAVHFEIDFGGNGSRQKCGWFMFRVDDAGGKKVRIDLTNIGRYDNWKTLNPVFAQIPNLSEPKYFRSTAPEDGYKYVTARNGSRIPWTKGYQRWHYIRNVETKDTSDTLVLRQRFTKDHVYVAMRPPFTRGYRKKLYAKLREKSNHLKIHNVGISERGNRLQVIQIGTTSGSGSRPKPTILGVFQEHGDEHDTSWVADGMIRFLAGSSQRAESIREKVNVLLVPLMDPDATEQAKYKDNLHQFQEEELTRTTKAYANWLQSWLNDGNRIDLALNVHNVESSESSGKHLFSAFVESKPFRKEFSKKIIQNTAERLRRSGFQINDRTGPEQYTFDRMTGFLWRSVKTLQIFWEVNSQASSRHLTLHQLRRIGKQILLACIDVFETEQGLKFLKRQAKRHKHRLRLLNRYELVLEHQMSNTVDDPVEYEQWLRDLPKFEAIYRQYRKNPNKKARKLTSHYWFYKLYD